MPVPFFFPQQFFAMTSPVDDGRVLLAGGFDPITGSRSAFQASIACFDYVQGRVVWQTDIAKSYPFRELARTAEVVAAILPQNFERCPAGLFQFDLSSGEALPATHEVPGWKLKYVDARQNRFSFSWVADDKSYLRVVAERDGTVSERTFPYHSTAGGKILERVLPLDESDHVAIFSFVEGKRVSFSIERWRAAGEAPLWESRTPLRNAVRNESVLLMWSNTGPQLHLQTFSIDGGGRQASLTLPLPDVVTIRPIDTRSYAVLSICGAHVIDIETRQVVRLAGMDADDFLDFGSLAVDHRAGKLLVATSGNHRRPGTNLMTLDL